MHPIAQVLVVDDEPDLRKILRILLESNHYAVTEAASGEAAIAAVRTDPKIELILLDILMPGLSGTEACVQIRQFTNAPILFLTALTQETDKAVAYRSGGDDYLAKPFSQAELLMKVESLLRRYRVYQGREQQSASQAMSLAVEPGAVICDGRRVVLTDKEQRIIAYLWEHRGQVCSVAEIYEDVWNEKYLSTSSNTVMVHILNLRKKLERDPDRPALIRTVWGKGYQID